MEQTLRTTKALADSEAMAGDREKLKAILSLEPDALCRKQKKRCESRPHTRERAEK